MNFIYLVIIFVVPELVSIHYFMMNLEFMLIWPVLVFRWEMNRYWFCLSFILPSGTPVFSASHHCTWKSKSECEANKEIENSLIVGLTVLVGTHRLTERRRLTNCECWSIPQTIEWGFSHAGFVRGGFEMELRVD